MIARETSGKRRGAIMLGHLTIRPPVHQALAEPHSVAQGRSAPVSPSRPVTPTTLATAAQQADRPGAAATQFPHAPTPASAEAAADAARRAYIRASIAAGINPLPLPGR